MSGGQLSSSRKWRLLAEKPANLPSVTFHKKDKIKRGRFGLGAPVLAAGKGWVLAVLAMLAAKRRLRVAARGSGPGAEWRRPCPPLRAVAAQRRRDEGRPATSTPRGPAGPASNKGWFRGGGAVGSRASPSNTQPGRSSTIAR